LNGLNVTCPNGACVSNAGLCDSINGCPYYFPYKCLDGACVKDASECRQSFECSSGNKLCPDGSCVPDQMNCFN